MNIRKIVLTRLDELDMSRYALKDKLKGKVSEWTLYDWCSGRSEGINSVALGHILDALGLTIKEK